MEPTRIKHKDAAIIARPRLKSNAVFTTDPKRANPQPLNIPVEEVYNTFYDWAKYGDQDSFPAERTEKLKLLSIGNTALSNNADAHYGAGIIWVEESVSDKGKLRKTPKIFPFWKEFVNKANYLLTHGEFILFMEHFFWCPIRFLTNEAGTEIMEVEALDPSFCRIGKRNKHGVSEKLFFSYLFDEKKPSAKDRIEYNLYDPTNPNKFKEFVYIFYYRTPGMKYYPTPDYYSVFLNGWVDVSISVPELIKTIYQSGASIKYHVHIPMTYFKSKYKDWDEKSEENQIKIYEDETDAMNTFLTGTTNAHKTFLSVFGMDEYGKELPGWKIEPVKNYLDSTAELPNNAAANSEILFAMGVDPALIGLGIPGGKNLSGSGSDKREAMKNKQSTLHMERNVTLQLPRFIAAFNKWPVGNAEPKYLDTDTSTTMDENPTGKETVING